MSNERIAEILGLPSLQIRLKKCWGSLNDGYRDQIRGELASLFPEATELRDLHQLPVVPGGAVSITHTRTVGGYCLTQTQVSLGFDVEANARLDACQMEWVSRYREENAEAPSAGILWTAKEAAFKSLSSKTRVKGLSDVQVFGWSEVSSNVYRFYAESKLAGDGYRSRGLCWKDAQFTYSLSVV